MSYASVRNVPIFRIAAVCALVLGALTVSVGDADAARKKKRIGRPAPPPFSHIVLDAKSGKTLEAFRADEQRYPASLTKVMTLYLLFEQLEAGKLKLSSPLPVSKHAASRPPTKLGLKPGGTLRVDDAIKALVTKSANDAAAVVAEAIGGSEAAFARMMTAKARSLGMNRTTYANASGLPNPHQVTTARDQALLGSAIQARFPRQYKYFATNSFHFRGREIRTHNRLLGQVEGVDGIKTGYTHASGFNLVTSVRRDRRHIVAVVIGGRTGRSRDAFMRKLINEYIDDASTGRATPPRTAEAPVAAPTAPAAEASANLAASQPQPPASLDPAALPLSVEVSVPSVANAGAPDAGLAPEVQIATADRPIVLADASLTRAALRKPERAEATAARAWGYPSTIPPWFPYLLVALIGCVGSLLSAFFSMVPTRLRRSLPQSA